METYFPYIITAISLAVLVLVFLVYRKLASSDNSDTGIVKVLHDEFRDSRKESSELQAAFRKELQDTLKFISDNQKSDLELFRKQIDNLTKSNETRINETRESIEKKLTEIRENNEKNLSKLQESNEKKLEEMRKTVDEKLQSTLEKRLGESFKLVSDRLENVQKGLGEMQKLATGVGDLKNVLTNVKTRGNFGEYQLDAILEQFLTPEQYSSNVKTKENTQELVDFAIILPGQNSSSGKKLLLPIDSKFPMADYERLIDAYDTSDSEAIETYKKALIKRVTSFAKSISEKYINPPLTTDFAIMFVPTEGLYSEILREPGKMQEIQEKHRITVVGPTNIVAYLTSLRMGFRTLAIEKRSSEVWELLGTVKAEFGKFGDVLDKVKKQLDAASNTINDTGVRTRAIERNLKDVQELPVGTQKQIEDPIQDPIELPESNNNNNSEIDPTESIPAPDYDETKSADDLFG